jgi:hypothetical protein
VPDPDGQLHPNADLDVLLRDGLAAGDSVDRVRCGADGRDVLPDLAMTLGRVLFVLDRQARAGTLPTAWRTATTAAGGGPAGDADKERPTL